MVKKRKIQKKDLEKDTSWIEKDGIIHLDMSKVSTKDDIEEAIEKTRKFIQKFEGKARILINITPYLGPPMRTSKFRRGLSEKAKEMMKIGFKKAAVFGGNATTRTIASFIITAARLKNVKLFNSEKEALKWLKEP